METTAYSGSMVTAWLGFLLAANATKHQLNENENENENYLLTRKFKRTWRQR